MTVGQLFELLPQTELLSAEQLAELRRKFKGVPRNSDATYLSNWLVDRGWLTPWQVEQLVAGYTELRIGNYVLIDYLGQGGMGAVYKAEHRAMGRTVAIKVLSNARLNNPRAIARFQREVRAAAQLDHPNIITAHDAGQIRDRYFLVMEFADGRDLNAWYKHFGRLPIPWACEFIRQAALGLQHAHDCGMVHRDIKPANLLVVWNDPQEMPLVKILDLGLARSMRDHDFDANLPAGQEETVVPELTGDTVTQHGQIVGTPDFLSPEQIQGQHVDARSDLFSLGCTLYKLLTGQLPFGGRSMAEKIQNRIALASPPALAARTICPEVPPELDAVLLKLLERDPKHRFATAAEVAEALVPFAYRVPGLDQRRGGFPAIQEAATAASSAAPTASSLNLASAAPPPPPPTMPNWSQVQPSWSAPSEDNASREFLRLLALARGPATLPTALSPPSSSLALASAAIVPPGEPPKVRTPLDEMRMRRLRQQAVFRRRFRQYGAPVVAVFAAIGVLATVFWILNQYF